MNAPRLSIVIPSHSRVDYLRECLESLALHRPFHCEVLVIDDASNRGIVSQTALQFPFVHVFRLSTRSGFCVASNIGIELARGEIVELLNDDTAVSPGWAEAALEQFDKSNVIAVAPLVMQWGTENVIDSAGDDYDYGGFAKKRGHGLHPNEFELRAGPVWGVNATAGFYRRSALLEAGLFPTDFGAYFEDVDLAHRLRTLGEIRFEPSSVVRHRISSSYGIHPSAPVLEQQSCNEERVFWRNVKGWNRLRNLPRHFAVLIGKAMRRLKEGTFGPWSRGRLRAWLGVG